MGEAEEIRHDTRPGFARYYLWFLCVFIPVPAIQIVLTWNAWRSAWVTALYVVWLISLLVIAALLLRPALIVINEDGIKRPLRRPIPWADIEAVNRPGRFDEYVPITLRNGRSLPLLLPKRYAEQVARIGNRPLQDPPKPT
ncbi:hypothetical protein BJY21_002438 [Kineosphaera limosa]|uniref:PH domain-containing protein n=1 Tax=Kineosphaera limosa NBRC 100340 TaxID=1184609 RepID=K6VIA1_9MICO|nr:PH domain-containing protein [Kineosphaera limosa]NYE01254.1 hypothetical protein [Kineosphaera limosa]GAB95948.1 hypothetical protein KILIM_029_00580 [Kineosphaera limosa NBRC 100340]